MATKQEKKMVHAAAVGLAGIGMYYYFKSRNEETAVLAVQEAAGAFGAPLDDDEFHGYGNIFGVSLKRRKRRLARVKAKCNRKIAKITRRIKRIKARQQSKSMDGFGGYGTIATDASNLQYFPGTSQGQIGPSFPLSMGYLPSASFTPLGEVCKHQGWYCSQAHPGLSHQQWVQMLLWRHENPQSTDFSGYGVIGAGVGDLPLQGFGDFGAYGDACSRLERKYKKKLAKYRKKQKKFSSRGRRFLGIRVGDGSKRLARLKKKYVKVREKAISKGCEWPGAKKRKKDLASAKSEERRIERQMQEEFETAQANISEQSALVASQAGQGGINPVLIIGGVGAVAVALLVMRKKRTAA